MITSAELDTLARLRLEFEQAPILSAERDAACLAFAQAMFQHRSDLLALARVGLAQQEKQKSDEVIDRLHNAPG